MLLATRRVMLHSCVGPKLRAAGEHRYGRARKPAPPQRRAQPAAPQSRTALPLPAPVTAPPSCVPE
jgi:hypothetical protein